MKWFLFIGLLLGSVHLMAQKPNNYTQDIARRAIIAGKFDSTLHIPFGPTPRLGVGGWNANGAIFYRTTDSSYYIWNGSTWERQLNERDSAKFSGPPKVKEVGNGATSKMEGDSVKVSVGGILEDSVTLFYIPVGAKTDQSTLAGSRSFVISNRPFTGFSGTDWGYWNRRGNNSLLSLERMLYESENDTAYTQYMGVDKSLSRMTFERNSPIFSYTTKPIMVQEQGRTATVQIYFPEHKVALKPSPHGRTGAAFNGTSGFGQFYGYDVAIEPTIPGYPQSSNVAQTDFNRNADDNYRKKMTGPITNYLAFWKAHQTTINAGTIEAGSTYEQMTDFFSYGDLYPSIGTDKAKILAVSRVENATGFYSREKRGDLNQVWNGYGFVQDGVNDFNYFQGKLRIGGTKPVWTTLTANDMPFSFDVLNGRVRIFTTDTSGTGIVKGGPMKLTQLTRRFLDLTFTQSQNFSASRIVQDLEAKDAVIFNTSLNGISAGPADESRAVYRQLAGSVGGTAIFSTNGGIRFPHSVRSAYTMLGSTGNIKLNGYFANYVSGLDIYKITDTIKGKFFNYAANNGNILNGVVEESYGLYINNNPMALADYGVYQSGVNVLNVFEGRLSANRAYIDTIHATAPIPLGDKSDKVATTTFVNDFVLYQPANSAASSTITVNTTSLKNVISVQNLSVNITSIPNPSTFDKATSVLISFSDDGVARSISGWGSAFRVGDIPFPTTTTVGKVTHCYFQVDPLNSKIDFVGMTQINK